MPRLTERQAAFARHLITGMSATEAARKAGYSHSYADRQAKTLIEKPQVRAYLDELRAEVQNDAIMDAQEVLERLTGIARGEGFADKATKQGVVQMGPEWTDQLKALEGLGKYHALFVERKEVNGSLTVTDLLDLAEED